MGNTPLDSLVTSTVSSIGEDIPWSKQFTMLDKQPLNNTYILHHIPTNNSYKVKHLTLNKTQHQQIFRQIDIKKNTPSPFVTKLQKTQQYTVKGYCSEHQEVFLMYKYVQTNLKQEILNRRFRQEKFLQQQIKVIMEAGVKGITYLNEIGCTPKGLNTSEILLTNQRAVLVNDPWLSVGSTLLTHTDQQKSNNNDNQQSGSKIYSIPVEDYPSPQKILYMNQLIDSYNQWLSQLFTFGIIILEAIFMSSLNDILYDKSQKKIYYHKVKEKIQQIVENQQLQITIGAQSILSEIKQDLRRLLSNQPKIRQSVYLKYKKNHSSYLFLKKPKDQFKIDNLQKNNGGGLQQQQQKMNKITVNNQSKQLYDNNNNQINNKNNRKVQTKYYNMISEHNEKQKQPPTKQNWLLNSINDLHYINLSKDKQSQNNNKFRVVSSSLPLKNNNNNFSNNFNTSKVNNTLQKQINNNNINVGYRQLGGISQSITNQQPRPNSFLSKFNTNNNHRQQNHGMKSYNTNYINNYGHNSYSNKGLYQLSSINTTTNYFNKTYQDMMKVVRTGQLSPKKETLVEKQSQVTTIFKYPQYNNKTSTYPSSPYLSTISTNAAYQSQITPTIMLGQDYCYNSTNNNNNTTSNVINLPPHMVTRSSSSYVVQNNNSGKLSNYNNADKYNSYSMLSYKLPQIMTNQQQQFNNYNNNNTWTYDTMVTNNNNNNPPQQQQTLNTNNNNSNNPYNNNNTQQKHTTNYPTKISLSQSYLNKYQQFYSSNDGFYNNHQYNNSSNQQYLKQGEFGTKRSQFNISDSYNAPTYGSGMSSYQAFKQNFNTYASPSYLTGNEDAKNYNNFSSAISQQPQQHIQSNTLNQSNTINQQPITKIPSYKQLNNLNFRQVGSLYCEDSHFLNDKQSIVIESYSGGMNLNKYQQRAQTPINTFGINNNNAYSGLNNNMPTISPKESFQINHSAINNTRIDGKSFSSMDEDVKELRKFGQQNKQSIDKKPNSSYSSSQKVSLIDKIYDPQVMGSFDRRSFDNHNSGGKQDYFGRKSYEEEGKQGHNNRSSENINNHRSAEKNAHSRNNSSQNYLQTPERYPNKYKLNSTIRQASCEDSGVNQSHNNSNGDSYEHQKIYPNTEISKYQQINQERRYSERKPQEQHEKDNQHEKGFKTDRGGKRSKQTDQQQNSQKLQENSNHQRVTLYADGSRYVGPTDQNGESNGFGVLYYPDGHVAYEGQWQHGDFNGKGRLYNPYELKMQKSFDYRDLTKMDEYIKQFEGTFSHDIKQGKGILKMHNNQVYEGYFNKDLPNGRGKFYCSDGNVVEGKWERGYLQEAF